MSKPISFGELDFKIVASMDKTYGKPEPETPFRICVMGNFSGRANSGIVKTASALEPFRLFEVDRDNMEDVMYKLGVEVHPDVAGITGPPVAIRFSEVDDFHPEQLYTRLDVFQTLKDTRKRLNDPATFESAVKEVRTWISTTPETSKPVSEQPAPTPAPSGKKSGSLLDRIVDEAEDRQPDEITVTEPSEWDSFMQKIVGPYLVPGDDPEQEELVAAVDASISGLMEKILHHPDFQAIEAAWRALRFLVYRVETGALLRVYLLDISKADLAADLSASEDLQSTGIYKLFVEKAVGTPGGEPWAVLAGNYTFNETQEDAETLGRMARIARAAGAPFISGAHARILGCESLADTPDPDDWRRSPHAEAGESWKALRSLPEASYLGLALPRFLLRLPYGADTDPVDYFEFEEMSEGAVHDNYLWGNPCFACVLLLAQAFSHSGWDLRPGVIRDIQGLPLHVYKEQGESVTKPCAEVLFTERAMERVLENGVMSLLSFKDQDNIRLTRFQSLTDPLTQLSGLWD